MYLYAYVYVHIHRCVCIYVYVQYMYVYMYACLHVCVRVCVCGWVAVCACTNIHVYNGCARLMNIYVCIYLYGRACPLAFWRVAYACLAFLSVPPRACGLCWWGCVLVYVYQMRAQTALQRQSSKRSPPRSADTSKPALPSASYGGGGGHGGGNAYDDRYAGNLCVCLYVNCTCVSVVLNLGVLLLGSVQPPQDSLSINCLFCPPPPPHFHRPRGGRQGRASCGHQIRGRWRWRWRGGYARACIL